ncbi:ornithine decarboxylase 1 [Scaptodrosophila lebanonensis]|uniref:ornithine decarboxylase n=1 Tax=Drosophila lebanonensis TaxID=7225 RepID=A0A6J2T236_DROLE|nr:ornithine decarboxylase 1 [Scaptodrosophila lebanonensis]
MCENYTINYYENVLDIKQIIEQTNLQCMDEALNICDLSGIERKYQLWQSLLPRITPYYAVKCNDDPLVVKTLANLGVGFDCASKNEIKQVLSMAVDPERIIFANPCKPVSHLEYAQQQGITTGTVDNEFEIYKLFKHYPSSNLVVRFRSEAKAAQCPLGDKFGSEDVSTLMLLAKSLDLNVTGTSFHVGSGCSDFPAYERAIKTAKNIFKFGELLGYDMDLLDIGGGFSGDNDDNFKEIATIVDQAVQKHFPEESIKIISEPGRFFVSAAYTLVCKIHAKREVRNKDGKLDTIMYYLNDGVYGSFNCILYDHQVVTAQHYLDDDTDLPMFKTLIWGPTCDALDKISEELYLPNLNRGDLLGFPNMGAYTVPVASPFNGFLQPKTLYFQCRAI